MSNAVGNVICPDCAILSRQLEAARNRIADDCESAETNLARSVAERRQMRRNIRLCQWLAVGALVAGVVLGRVVP